MIFISSPAMGGMDTSSVEMMPMSEYASAQNGSASGSLAGTTGSMSANV